MVDTAGRRTRAEQRAATRAALFEATIESLIEVGYRGTTTRAVATRAGVSQGAQQHYYPTKPELVEAALVDWFQHVAPIDLPQPDAATAVRDRIGVVLDSLWLIHNHPLATALFEIIAAARSDHEQAVTVARGANQLHQLAHDEIRAHVPEVAAAPNFRSWLYTTLATLRGAALLAPIPDTDPAINDWPAMREHLLDQLDAVLTDVRTR